MTAPHTATPERLRAALERAFRTATVPGFPARLVAQDAEAAAAIAMRVTGPVVEAQRARIAELEAELARYRGGGPR